MLMSTASLQAHHTNHWSPTCYHQCVDAQLWSAKNQICPEILFDLLWTLIWFITLSMFFAALGLFWFGADASVGHSMSLLFICIRPSWFLHNVDRKPCLNGQQIYQKSSIYVPYYKGGVYWLAVHSLPMSWEYTQWIQNTWTTYLSWLLRD